VFLHIPATNSCGASIPRFYACSVRKFDGENGKKARAWTRIGFAFPHQDGTGFNIEVHSFPLDGRIVLFPADSEARTEEGARQRRGHAGVLRHGLPERSAGSVGQFRHQAGFERRHHGGDLAPGDAGG
jgi:hypothetical protein